MKCSLAVLATLAVIGTSRLIGPLGQAPTAMAQTPPVDHSKMDHSKMAPAAAAKGDTPSTAAYKAANDKMHAGMNISFSGNADKDFVNGMIPHHQGAVEMAKIVLQYGNDPAFNKLARDIVKAQDTEMHS